MRGNWKAIRVFNLLLCTLEIILFVTGIILLYLFFLLKESVYVTEGIVVLIITVMVVAVNIQIEKLVNFEEIEIKNKKKRIKRIGEELEEFFKDEKNIVVENCGRKSKRYTAKPDNAIKIRYSQQRCECNEVVCIIDISRTGMMITSNHKISNNIKVEFDSNEIVEGEVVRNGILESRNLYFYGIKFKDVIKNKNFKQII